METSQDCFETREDGSLNILIQRPPLQDDCCHTVHLTLACPSATDYSPRETYTAVKAWFCGQPASKSAGIRRCVRHWFSQFVCYAADQQPVAIANTSTQLAQLLSVPAVFLLDADSRQPLETSGWVHSAPLVAGKVDSAHAGDLNPAGQAYTAIQGNPAGHACVARQAGPAGQTAPAGEADPAGQACPAGEQQQQQATTAVAMEVELSPAAGQYVDDVLILDVPAPQGNWTNNACAALFIVLDIDSAGCFQPGQHTVLETCRCGNEAGKQVFCSRHRKVAHVCLLTKNRDALWAGSTLAELAAAMGVKTIQLKESIGDLADKLAATSTATTATEDGQQQQHAAATMQQQGAEAPGAVTGVASSSDGSLGAAPPTAAGLQQSTSIQLKSALLRIHLTNDQHAQQNQQQHPAQVFQLHQSHTDVYLGVASNPRIQQPCLGLNLRLNVGNVQELAASRGPILVADGRRCANEGGHKRCCKQHKAALIMMMDFMGSALPGAANLDELASMIKVSSVEVLDRVTFTPVPDYQQLPPSVKWQAEPDNKCFRIWLPNHSRQNLAATTNAAAAGSGGSGDHTSQQGDQPRGPAAPQQQQQSGASLRQGGVQCAGLDFTVALQQGQHTMGSSLPVLQVVRCTNLARSTGSSSNSTACRKHQSGLLHLLPYGAAAATSFQMCRDLAELAIWLGVNKVEALDSDTGQPVSFYKSLAPAPLQLSMPGPLWQQQQQQVTQLTPPSLQVQPPQGWGSGGTAAAAAMDQGAQLPAVTAARVTSNCTVELLAPADGAGSGSSKTEPHRQGDVQGYVIKIPSRPIGPCNHNPCRALDVTVALTNGQTVWTPGKTQYQLVAVQRCANEAGNKSRCRSHNEAAVRLWALVAGITLYQQQQQQVAATQLAKISNSADLAQQLGVEKVVVQCQDAGEDLGDICTWSPSNDRGTAAKLQPAAAAAVAAAGDKEAAAAAVPAVVLPAALQATLGSICLQAGTQGTLQPQQQQQQQQQQQPPQQHQQAAAGSDVLDVAAKAAAAAAAAAASMPPDTSRLRMYQSGVSGNAMTSPTVAAVASAAAGSGSVSGVPVAASTAPAIFPPISSLCMQQDVAQSRPAVAVPLVLQSSGVAAALAAGPGAGWATAAASTPGLNVNTAAAAGGGGGAAAAASFSTSGPLAKLARLFPAPPSGKK